ncbi:hypothetical protein BH24CHL1_BH24CHL1_10080 [soil metagenome]
MAHKHSRRKVRSFLFAFILILGLLPVGVVTADHRTATRTEISFVSTPVEILVPGEESVDEAGIFRSRGEVARDEVTGDITGEAIITFNGDFVPSPNCDPDDLDNCFEGEFTGWGTVVITDENGTWEGDFLIAFAFFEGEEPFMFGKVVLAGRGGNAGKSIVADITFPEDEEDESATFNGVMLTMAVPAFGLNMSTQLCFNEETFETTGAFLSHGMLESYGGATGEFFTGGSQWTTRYGLYGELTFTDEWGSMTIQFLGEAQDHPESSVGWGHFVIVGGTGAYAELYGHGKITGAAMEAMQCDAGFGVRLQLIGQGHFN